MISVVMATYNGERYVEKQLQSILNQSLMPDEVIIRDDGSTDSTVQIVQKFIDSHNLSSWEIKVNDENLGYRKNFANLLSLASGDYIFLSDQDDEWFSDKISKMVKIFKDNKDIQALNGSISLIDGNSNKIKVVKKKNMYNENLYFSTEQLNTINRVSLATLVVTNITPGCAMAITKELRDSFIKTYEFILPHDWYLNMLAAYNKGCYFFFYSVIGYRIHANNTIGVDSEKITDKLDKFDSKKRIRDFQAQVGALSKIEKIFGEIDVTTKDSRDFVLARIEFYKNPNFKTLFKLRNYVDYKNRTAVKGRLWDIILSLKIDKFIYAFKKK